jgi:hypothetical protein
MHTKGKIGNKQALQEKTILKQTINSYMYNKDMLHGIQRHRANTINEMWQKQRKRKHVEAQRRYG